MTDTALLYSHLRNMGADVRCMLPSREGEGYGLSEKVIRSLADKGYRLIITVDNGISAGAEAELAAQLGVGACAASAFDAAYYAETNPDVATACGTDEASLLRHYLSSGQAEGRKPSARGKAGDSLKLTNEQIALVWSPVPLKDLANYKSLKKKMTDEQYQAAYQEAVNLVLPVALSSREEQLTYIAAALRERFDSGMSYSMDADHYNDPYGYFVLGSASCAGCTRATGLCLNVLGIPYEHVNENQYSHQWCRVPVGDTYWICDAYGLYCGPEPAPYQHPYFQ